MSCVFCLRNLGKRIIQFCVYLKYPQIVIAKMAIIQLWNVLLKLQTNNNCFVATIGPGELLNNKDKIHRSDIKSLTSNISDDDNPILIYFKFN